MVLVAADEEDSPNIATFEKGLNYEELLRSLQAAMDRKLQVHRQDVELLLSTEIQNLRQDLDACREDARAHSDERGSGRSELRRRQHGEELCSPSERLRVLTEAHGALHEALRAKDEELQRVRHELSQTEQGLKNTQHELRQKDEQLLRIKQNLERSNHKLNGVTEECVAAQECTHGLRAELDHERQELDRTQTDLRVSREDVDALEKVSGKTAAQARESLSIWQDILSGKVSFFGARIK